MPLDPQAQAILTAVRINAAPEFWQLTPDQAREQYALRVTKLELKAPVHRVTDRHIEGPGSAIALRIYDPREAAEGERLPALVFFHGGGYVIGSLDTHDSLCRLLCMQGDCRVISVNYRLAPEAKFPAAVDDAVAALRWIAGHPAELGIDPKRIAVGGDSAGANLATVLAILARDSGGPALAFQLLIYPVTAPEPETPSHRQFAEGYLLTRNTMTWFFKQYQRTPRDCQDFRYAPLVTEDLSNLPPALILTAGYDPLRDEGVDYAKRLIEAGNRVALTNYEGMVHGFILMGGALDAARRAVAECAAALRQVFREAGAVDGRQP